jgi:hypothetical protein
MGPPPVDLRFSNGLHHGFRFGGFTGQPLPAYGERCNMWYSNGTRRIAHAKPVANILEKPQGRFTEEKIT